MQILKAIFANNNRNNAVASGHYINRRKICVRSLTCNIHCFALLEQSPDGASGDNLPHCPSIRL